MNINVAFPNKKYGLCYHYKYCSSDLDQTTGTVLMHEIHKC
jgi:hypothetical protein